MFKICHLNFVSTIVWIFSVKLCITIQPYITDFNVTVGAINRDYRNVLLITFLNQLTELYYLK